MGEWISVEDRLPGEKDYKSCRENLDGAVLWFNGNEMGLGWFYRSTWQWADLYDEVIEPPVTHWMPMPEPPKGGE